MIIIFVVEGKHCNTEVNFFKGLSHYFCSLELRIYPLEKTKKSEKRKTKIIGRIQNIMMEHIDELENIWFFFIGDGDKQSDFESMDNTKNIIFKYITTKLEIKENKIINKVLRHISYKFEDSYKKITNGYFPSFPKKKSNINIFEQFAKKANWSKNDKLNYSKIINDMKKIDNPHIKIIEKIKEYEKQ